MGQLDAGASYLCDSLLLASDETEESAKHTEEGKDSTSKSNTSFGMGLESDDGVFAREGNERECLVAKELDRVLSKGQLIKRFLLIGEGSLVRSLLEGMFDVERLRSQGLGIINGVTNVDVVEKDIFRHGPKLNTNPTLFILVSMGKQGERKTYNLIKALNGCKIFKVVRVLDLARGPFALVGGVVNHGGVPLALVDWIWLVGAIE